ncbi:RpiB/LacA/LacB family sugar-phosphate isomerase [bacterium]|nr:RpiB/LacA/LacB family sugar-phosphate isomerase [bacterium]
MKKLPKRFFFRLKSFIIMMEMKIMKIFIGADHRGYAMAQQIYEELKKENYEIFYTKVATTESDDYPDFAFDVSKHVMESPENLGILLCGNGIGISIAANKVKGIRCARVINEDDAYKARNHNGANVIAFGGLSLEEAMKIVHKFIMTPAANEERHLKRIQKIINYENGEYNEL